RAEHAGVETMGRRDPEPGLELGHPRLGSGQGENAALHPADIRPEVVPEVPPQPIGFDRQRELQRIPALLTDETETATGLMSGDRPLLEDEWPETSTGEMVGGGTSDNAAADDYRVYLRDHSSLCREFTLEVHRAPRPSPAWSRDGHTTGGSR